MMRMAVVGMAAGIAVVACSSVPRANVPTATAPLATPPPPSATPASTVTSAPVATITAAAVRYVAIGASDTVGVGAADPLTGSWPARIALLLPPGSTYTNVGVSGSLASAARLQQLPRAVAARPTVVTIWLAVNDLNGGVDVAAYESALGGIVDALVAGSEARVFVGTVPDLRTVPVYAQVDPAVLLARIEAYNQAIARTAAKAPERVRVIDLFTGSADLITTAVVAADGFHPTDAGYQLIADRFSAQMRARGVPLRG